MQVIFFTPDLSNNSLGRTFCLWEMATELGWDSIIVSTKGDAIWGPLSNTTFARACVKLSVEEIAGSPVVLGADAFIAVKPVPESFEVASALSADRNVPLLLDVDDPDLDSVLSWQRPVRRLAKSVIRRKQFTRLRHLVKQAQRTDTIVSNPVLQKRYGGSIVPHTRRDSGNGASHVSESPMVAFVGTNHSHKGLSFLREAVARLQATGFRLTITDYAPADAKDWEVWTGPTSFVEGQSIVANSDIVVIPSLDLPFARGQLPAKLVDAMIFGRAIVVTDIEPMPWALGSHGRVVEPGSVDAIEKALLELTDPSIRKSLGDRARARAQEMFTVEKNVETFRHAVLTARPSTHAK